MSEYARVESVPSAMLPFDTMRLFRYVKDKDAVWDALMDYFEAVRVRNCDLDAVPMAEFPRGLERDAYLSFCETIRKTVEGYWRRVEQNAENARKRRVQPEKEKAEPEAVQAEAKETGTVQCAAKECEPNKHSEGDAERQTVQTGLQESRSVPQESRNVRLAAMVGHQETVDARWEAKACDPVPQSEGKGDREPVGTEWVTNGYPSGGQINKRINKSINQESNKENKPYVSSLSAPSGADARVCARVREDGADPFGDGMGDAYAFTSGPKDGDTPEQEGPAKCNGVTDSESPMESQAHTDAHKCEAPSEPADPEGFRRLEKSNPFADASTDTAGNMPSGAQQNPQAPDAKARNSLVKEAFARFWEAYPRKTARASAERLFRKLSPDGALLDVMLGALEKQKHTRQWRENGGRFIPYPASWLYGRRWEDEEFAPCPAVQPDQPVPGGRSRNPFR